MSPDVREPSQRGESLAKKKPETFWGKRRGQVHSKILDSCLKKSNWFPALILVKKACFPIIRRTLPKIIATASKKDGSARATKGFFV